MTLKDNISGAVAIVVNSTGERYHNQQALRVDLLHELAHVLFDPPNGDGRDLRNAALDPLALVVESIQDKPCFVVEIHRTE